MFIHKIISLRSNNQVQDKILLLSEVLIQCNLHWLHGHQTHSFGFEYIMLYCLNYRKCTRPQAIQDVEEFVSLTEQIW